MDEESRVQTIIGVWEFRRPWLLIRMIIAEFIGTFLLVLIGCGSVIIPSTSTDATVRIALTFGLVLATVAQTIGYLSGGHVNPVVSLSFFATLEISLIRTLIFICVQIGGAAAGAAALYIYWAGPIPGAILAGLCYKYIFRLKVF